jgi:hypothetical protein
VVIVETAWVIKRIYGFADAEVAAAIESLLEANNVIVENEQAVFAAMRALKEGRGSLADSLIGNISSRVGCFHTLTFDRKARASSRDPQRRSAAHQHAAPSQHRFQLLQADQGALSKTVPRRDRAAALPDLARAAYDSGKNKCFSRHCERRSSRRAAIQSPRRGPWIAAAPRGASQ